MDITKYREKKYIFFPSKAEDISFYSNRKITKFKIYIKNRLIRGELLVPVSSSLLSNLYDSFFIIHKENEIL